MADYLSLLRCFELGASGWTPHANDRDERLTFADVLEASSWVDGRPLLLAYQNFVTRELVLLGSEGAQTSLSPAGKTDSACFDYDYELPVDELRGIDRDLIAAFGPGIGEVGDVTPFLNGLEVKNRRAWARVAERVAAEVEEPALLVYDAEDPALAHVVDVLGPRSVPLRAVDKHAWKKISAMTGSVDADELWRHAMAGTVRAPAS